MTDVIYPLRSSDATPPLTVTGNQLARRRLSKSQRARIAARLMNGTLQLGTLTQGQYAALCKVSTTYALKMRRPQSAPQLQAAE
jgi:hypothetical protein